MRGSPKIKDECRMGGGGGKIRVYALTLSVHDCQLVDLLRILKLA